LDFSAYSFVSGGTLEKKASPQGVGEKKGRRGKVAVGSGENRDPLQRQTSRLLSLRSKAVNARKKISEEEKGRVQGLDSGTDGKKTVGWRSRFCEDSLIRKRALRET